MLENGLKFSHGAQVVVGGHAAAVDRHTDGHPGLQRPGADGHELARLGTRRRHGVQGIYVINDHQPVLISCQKIWINFHMLLQPEIKESGLKPTP